MNCNYCEKECKVNDDLDCSCIKMRFKSKKELGLSDPLEIESYKKYFGKPLENFEIKLDIVYGLYVSNTRNIVENRFYFSKSFLKIIDQSKITNCELCDKNCLIEYGVEYTCTETRFKTKREIINGYGKDYHSKLFFVDAMNYLLGTKLSKHIIIKKDQLIDYRIDNWVINEHIITKINLDYNPDYVIKDNNSISTYIPLNPIALDAMSEFTTTSAGTTISMEIATIAGSTTIACPTLLERAPKQTKWNTKFDNTIIHGKEPQQHKKFRLIELEEMPEKSRTESNEPCRIIEIDEPFRKLELE